MAPSKDPLAIGDILEIIQADKSKVVPELLESRTNIMRDNAGRYVSNFRLKRGLGEVWGRTCSPLAPRTSRPCWPSSSTTFT